MIELNTNKETLETKKEENKQNFFIETAKFILIAFLIVMPIRFFVAEPYVVNGSSMSPTFETADYLIVDKLSYKFGEPERGDVVVFRYPKDTSKFFIKRIIGLPTETVRIENGSVFIKNSNEKEVELSDEYVENHSFENISVILKDNEYFVMGDNRSGSSDSRAWGPLNKNLMTGKAFIRLFPITQIGLHPGEFNY